MFDSWTAYSTELREHDSKPVAHHSRISRRCRQRGIILGYSYVRIADLVSDTRTPRFGCVREADWGPVIANALGAALALLAD